MSARWVDSLLEWICLPFCRSVRHLLHANRLEFLPYRMIIGIYCREWVLGSWPSAFRIRGVIPSGPAALCVFNPWSNFSIPFVVNVTSGISSKGRISGSMSSLISVSWVKALLNCWFSASALGIASETVVPSAVLSSVIPVLSVLLCLINRQNLFLLSYSVLPSSEEKRDST